MTQEPVSRVVRDPRFERLVPAAAELRRLADGFLWAEGPVWLPDENALLWSDIPNNRVLRWSAADGAVAEVYRPSDFANGHTLDHDGRVLACEHGTRRVARYERDGSRTTIVDRYQGKRLNSPNDIVVASDGAIWFTDPPYGIVSDREGYPAPSELGACYVFRLDRTTGDLAIVSDDLIDPNGLAFSPDERTLYVSDTSSGRVENGHHHMLAFDVIARRSLGPPRVFKVIDPGVSDGFRVDVEGNVWTSAGDGIHVLTPDGTELGRILLPEPAANCTFGGVGRPDAVHHGHVDALVDRRRDPRRGHALGGWPLTSRPISMRRGRSQSGTLPLMSQRCSQGKGPEMTEFRSLHDLAKAARARLDDGTWDFLAGAAETESSLKRNRMGLDSLAFRPRVLNDVSKIDAATELLGHRLRIPVVLAPLGSIQLFDPEGGSAVARATAAFGTMMIHSSVCEPTFDVVAKVGTGPKIHQLYLYGDWAWMDEIIGRTVELGYAALCLTADTQVYSRRERSISRDWVPRASLRSPTFASDFLFPGQDDMGDGRAHQADLPDPARHQGHQHGRRRATGRGGRRRRRLRLEPRRAAARPREGVHRRPAGGGRSRRRAGPGRGRRRLRARDRRPQGALPRGDGRVRSAAWRRWRWPPAARPPWSECWSCSRTRSRSTWR